MWFGDILIFSTFKQNLRFGRILTLSTFMQNLWLKVKNILTSSMILYWKARLVQNPKFRWLKAMLTSYTFMQILRLKVLYISEKLSSWWIQNLRFWQILAKYTSMQNFRLRVKNTIKSCVIHHWKAKVLKNQKFEVMFNFENIYF